MKRPLVSQDSSQDSLMIEKHALQMIEVKACFEADAEMIRSALTKMDSPAITPLIRVIPTRLLFPQNSSSDSKPVSQQTPLE